ncbi:hypothetical protein PM082_009998 [Marasmius tenuissimus]|nr:hypothetical protein PM082_009998 [Marasmius tenuissimus]
MMHEVLNVKAGALVVEKAMSKATTSLRAESGTLAYLLAYCALCIKREPFRGLSDSFQKAAKAPKMPNKTRNGREPSNIPQMRAPHRDDGEVHVCEPEHQQERRLTKRKKASQ